MSDNKPDTMKLVIVIDGESADHLFAVGPVDLRDYFLPKGMNVKTEDIKRITFEQVTERTEGGWPYRVTTHKENYQRERLTNEDNES